jgi:hypothetical protein
MRLALLAIPLLLLHAACSGADRVTAPDDVRPRPRVLAPPERPAAVIGLPTGATRWVLERAAEGLTYTSESDYPFTWFQHVGPRVTEPLTPEAFRALIGVPATRRVGTVALDDFFARHIEWVDPYDATAVALVPRYQRLRETIRQVLRDPQVFRVGRIAIDCYIVGFDGAGMLVGLRTVAIET